jgi:hypothetical protein
MQSSCWPYAADNSFHAGEYKAGEALKMRFRLFNGYLRSIALPDSANERIKVINGFVYRYVFEVSFAISSMFSIFVA